jgi:hypothetical protein
LSKESLSIASSGRGGVKMITLGNLLIISTLFCQWLRNSKRASKKNSRLQKKKTSIQASALSHQRRPNKFKKKRRRKNPPKKESVNKIPTFPKALFLNQKEKMMSLKKKY